MVLNTDVKNLVYLCFVVVIVSGSLPSIAIVMWRMMREAVDRWT